MLNLQTLLTRAILQHASDLHLAPNMPPILRIDGELVVLTDLPILNAAELKIHLYQLLDANQQAQFTAINELDGCLIFPAVGNVRFNFLQQLHGMAAVFRIIPAVIPDLTTAAYPQILTTLSTLAHGLVLITGQTGSGKSTTLAAMIEYINQHKTAHIITIEDPIEFTYQHQRSLISQRQVGRDTQDAARALRAALREDPDVIMVGELRDLTTMRLALTAAETGHLVMATLHTPTAPRAINRIVDVFPGEEKNMVRNLLAESLQGVVCQQLVKQSQGGRKAIFEIMLGTTAIRNLIRDDKIAQMYHVMQTSRTQGMCTFDQYLAI